MKKNLFTLSLLCITLFSCKKNTTTARADTITTDAKIVWTGAVAADGCDWMVVTDTVNNTSMHPTNLSNDYKVNNLKVKITYHKIVDHTWGCGNMVVGVYYPDAPNALVIDAISKR